MNWIVIIGSTDQGLDLSSGCQMRLAGFDSCWWKGEEERNTAKVKP